jgi:hypothetical protein
MMLIMSDTPSLGDNLISADEIKTTLSTSGYLLEGRIAQVLQGRTAYVELNRFNPDPRDQGKSIEIDVWGQFPEPIDQTRSSVVAAEVLIECKNNSQPIVFFLKSQSDRWSNENHIKYSGFPKSSADPDTQYHVPLHQLLAMKDWHHYCRAPEIATQFCGFTRDQAAEEQKKQEKKQKPTRQDWCWKAESMEHYSKSFSDLCIVTEWASGGIADVHQQNIQLQFSYPIIVFQGPFYEARLNGGEVDLRCSNRLQLHHSASVSGQVIHTQIDVVSEPAFPALIEVIIEELRQIASGIRKQESRLLNSAVDQKRVALERQVISSLGPSRERDDLY